VSKHIFAFYKKNLQDLIAGKKIGFELCFKDPELWNRLVKIVRIRPQDCFILFDKTFHVTFQIKTDITQTKREICIDIKNIEKNSPPSPKIRLLLPILKKDALEPAIYCASATGVQEIIPVVTARSRKTLPEKDFSRLQKISIAACEQSKNFSIPNINNPEQLENALKSTKNYNFCILFDEDGEPATKLVEKIRETSPKSILITLGPEAGLEPEEIDLLKNSGFFSYKLTPTILRSREAVCIGLGFVRSVA
jgi:16S rRNA (uracil1498-N3)-methyltransferase